MIKAPWTPEQVEALNTYQQLGFMHEFTCPNYHTRRVLVASAEGWRCLSCDYTQDWAHEWMADKAAHPANPMELLKRPG